MVPTLSLLLMIPATLLLFGPIGIYLGDGVNWLYYYIMNLSPILLGGFIGRIWCVLVIFGAIGFIFIFFGSFPGSPFP